MFARVYVFIRKKSRNTFFHSSFSKLSVSLHPIMIVSNMNLHEVYGNLMADKQKIEWKRDALFPKVAKEMQRQGTYPAWVMYEYMLPSSNNKYIIYFHTERPYADIIGDYMCVLFDDNKRYIVKRVDTEIPEIHVLTSLFIQRYNERFLKQPELTADEVAVRYLTRNNSMIPMAVDGRINRRIDEYGEYGGEGFLVADGFCFKKSGEERVNGGEPVRIGLFTTFMPRSEMSDSQREAIFEECLRTTGNAEKHGKE